MPQTVIETRTGWMIRCRSCHWHEYPKTGKPGASWTFNGDLERPTFRPSMNEALGPFPEDSPWAGQIRRCHFTVTDGAIDYHGDCSHELRGKMPLEPWPQAEIDYHSILLADPEV